MGSVHPPWRASIDFRSEAYFALRKTLTFRSDRGIEKSRLDQIETLGTPLALRHLGGEDVTTDDLVSQLAALAERLAQAGDPVGARCIRAAAVEPEQPRVLSIAATVIDLVSEMYSPFDSFPDPSSISFEIERGRFDEGVAVGGSVSYRKDRLSIRVDPERFDWLAFLAIPYVSVHEAVAHLGAGHAAPGSQVFSEGFMDAIAFWVLERLAAAWDIGIPAGFLHESGYALRRATRQPFHESGQLALYNLAALIRRDAGQATDPAVLAIRLALALNASAAEIELKDQLVRQLAAGGIAGETAERLRVAAVSPRRSVGEAVGDLFAHLSG